MIATVKGDVHDIGKNIVGVVLGCNDYEVIDLGVMVPAARILETAAEHDADLIGLSGLITPSLDEMVHVASEMERLGMTTPLLIGGATTSRMHTAVKIAPAYSGPVVHVLDASRAVGVAGALVDAERRDGYAAEIREQYEEVRRDRADRQSKERYLPIEEARANGVPIDWSSVAPPRPTFLGVRTFDAYPLPELVDRIDWTPFFATWELRGAYPAILDDAKVGAAARDLFRDAQRLLDRIVTEDRLRAAGVVGFWRANADVDDIVLWRDEARTEELARFLTLRQQIAKPDGRPNLALADFVAPVASGLRRPRRGVRRHRRPRSRRAGRPRRRVRGGPRRLLGDPRQGPRRPPRRGPRRADARAGPSRAVGLRARRGAGQRRPHRGAIPGHPAGTGLSGLSGPHREGDAVRLLEAEARAGIRLTESYAMLPGASVSGYYLWHPDSHYFGIGRIERDQLEDYARARASRSTKRSAGCARTCGTRRDRR